MGPVQTALSSYRVLIVDDNEGIHHDFRTLLQPRRGPDELDELAAELFGDQAAADEPIAELPSYRCDAVFQGDRALENVKDAVANGESYALAFIDIRMPPGWDGVETILHLWEIDPNIQMVLCSAYSDYSWEEIVQKLGVSDKLLLLRKPFDPNSVKQLTLATTSRWHHERIARQRLSELEERLERCRTQLTALEAGIARSGKAFGAHDAEHGGPPKPVLGAEHGGPLPPAVVGAEHGGPSPTAFGTATDVQAALDDLTQTLDRLAAGSLRPEHGELVTHARDVAAALRAALGPAPRTGGAH
jgi:CheY-like chemotaxis protein